VRGREIPAILVLNKGCDDASGRRDDDKSDFNYSLFVALTILSFSARTLYYTIYLKHTKDELVMSANSLET